MNEPSVLRRTPFSPSWSILARRRSDRPVVRVGRAAAPPRCPFCAGHEAETERESFALRAPESTPDAPGWSVRVVPNKFPALTLPADDVAGAGRPYTQTPARGLHEVVVESPEHALPLGRFTVPQLEAVFGVYQSRLRALAAEPGIRSVQVFRNEGAAAGASQEHPHSQILALPMVPWRQRTELVAAVRHLRNHGGCVSCEMLEREIRDGARLVLQNGVFAAFASFAPRFPYEVWVLPMSHGHDFADAGRDQIGSLASLVADLLRAMTATLGTFPFNLILQTSPVDVRPQWRRAFHWRLEILPRLTVPSGFEMGSGVFIVALPPEAAAANLRRAVGSSVVAAGADQRPLGG